MPRNKKKQKAAARTSAWKRSLAAWTPGVGESGKTYSHSEHGNIYEIEPVKVGDRHYHQLAFTTGKQSPRVNFVNDEGQVIATPHLFESADRARIGAVLHYGGLRGKKHHSHMLTGASRSKFRKV